MKALDISDFNLAPGEAVRINGLRIETVQVPCPLGGRRLMWKCPRCGCPRIKLFRGASGRYVCRKCRGPERREFTAQAKKVLAELDAWIATPEGRNYLESLKKDFEKNLKGDLKNAKIS